MVLLCRNQALLVAVAMFALLMGLRCAAMAAKIPLKSHGIAYDEDEMYVDASMPSMCTASADGGMSNSCESVSEQPAEEGVIKMRLETTKRGLKVDLLHMDHHPQSPLHEPKSNLAERIRNAVKRSKHRASGLSRTLVTGKKKREIDLNYSDVAFSSSSRDSFESPVSASPGSYIMTLSLGTPPQTRTAIADTGSDLVWLQCSPCTSCYTQDDPVFNPSKSTSYQTVPCTDSFCSDLPYHACSRKKCQYGYAYGDQSTTQGDFAMETVTLTTLAGGTEPVHNFAFGCGHKNQGTFSGTDGLVGLGQGPISFPSQLGQLFGNKFSYCLVSVTDAATQTSPLIFGEAAAVEDSSALQYTPLVRNNLNPTFYYVLLTGISVDGTMVVVPANTFQITSSGSGGVILDSGTTITMLVQAAYKPFLARLKSLIQYPAVDSSQVGLDLCFDLSHVKTPTLPSVTLHFANADMELPAENVFLTVDDHGTTCLAFAGEKDFTIVGNIQQQNFYIVYDRQNQRVGFAPTRCDTLSSDGGVQSQR